MKLIPIGYLQHVKCIWVSEAAKQCIVWDLQMEININSHTKIAFFLTINQLYYIGWILFNNDTKNKTEEPIFNY